MTRHIVIATPELVEDGTLTALGTLAATLPAANLQDMQPGKMARWTSLSTVAVRLDLGAAAAINLVALGPHNASADAEWRIRAGDSEADADSGVGHDSTLVSMWPATGRPEGYDGEFLWSLYWIGDAPQTRRFWRIDVSDPTNADGYFQAGRLVVDAAWQPTKNLRYGWGLGWADPSENVAAIGGQRWPVRRTKGRVLTFSLGSMSENEMLGLGDEIQRKRGKTEDVLVVRDPEATTHLHRQIVHGQLAELDPFVNRTFGLYENNYRIDALVI